jgi:peptidoglycan hydrolase CwlO-like protein
MNFIFVNVDKFREVGLYRENTGAFTPDGDYEPATKKYVDDVAGAANAYIQTSTTVVDTNAAWDTDIWASTADIETLCIVESAATGVRYVVKINSNTADTLTVDALSGGYVVVAGDTYTIIRNSSAVDIKSVGGTAQTGGDWTTQFADIETDIEATNTALGTVNTNLGTIETDIEATNTALGTVNTNLGTIETDIEATNTALGTIETDIEATNTALGTVNTNLGTIETDIEATNTNLGTIETDIEATNTALGTVNTNLGTIETDIEATNTALGTVNTNLGTIEDDIEALAPATTPTIYNVSIAIADTEYSQALPANTKKFALSIIDGTPGENFRWAYETGKVATPTAPYRQLDQAFEYECDGITSSATVYVAASDVCVAQLEVWS